jgi:hypothetical protein
MLKLAFKPSITHCEHYFTVEVESFESSFRLALLLNCYQRYLSDNSYSQINKSCIELLRTNNRVHRDNRVLITRLFLHPFKECIESDKLLELSKARFSIHWMPKTPCSNPFQFPVNSIEEAKLFDKTLSLYDTYLLDNCENMRDKHSNLSYFMMKSGHNNWINWPDKTNEMKAEPLKQNVA